MGICCCFSRCFGRSDPYPEKFPIPTVATQPIIPIPTPINVQPVFDPLSPAGILDTARRAIYEQNRKYDSRFVDKNKYAMTGVEFASTVANGATFVKIDYKKDAKKRAKKDATKTHTHHTGRLKSHLNKTHFQATMAKISEENLRILASSLNASDVSIYHPAVEF